MQYMGGKYKIAKRIVRHLGKDPVLEPFMGGANISVLLPEGSVCSDADACLATLYQRVQKDGVDFLPTQLTRGLYEELRLREDPSNPLTAFAKYGCSYAGKPWGGWAKPNPNQSASGYYSECAKNSLRKVASTRHQYLARSFFDIEPGSYPGFTLYLDPPYRDTTGYRMSFDYGLFLKYAWDWAGTNAVFISEYTGDPAWELVEEFPRATLGLQIRNASEIGHTEKLFRVRRTIDTVPFYLIEDQDLG
jgi:DNA adenine methylase